MVISRVGAQLELEFGGGAGRFTDDGRRPCDESCPKHAPAGYSHGRLPPRALYRALTGSVRRTGIIRKVARDSALRGLGFSPAYINGAHLSCPMKPF
jgi:hypothetical protein